jgi:NADPH:quinone reductase-like Zn-dependent oxidoreductase
LSKAYDPQTERCADSEHKEIGMKAVVYEKNTSPNPFSYCDVEKPVPGDGEILIKVHTTSLNAADYRLFKMGLGIPKTKIFGADVAGTVESVGKDVLAFEPGDEVVADTFGCGFGGMAEYVRASQNTVVRKPTGVSKMQRLHRWRLLRLSRRCVISDVSSRGKKF